MPEKRSAEDLLAAIEAAKVKRQIAQELGESALLALGETLNKWEVPDDDEYPDDD